MELFCIIFAGTKKLSSKRPVEKVKLSINTKSNMREGVRISMMSAYTKVAFSEFKRFFIQLNEGMCLNSRNMREVFNYG